MKENIIDIQMGRAAGSTQRDITDAGSGWLENNAAQSEVREKDIPEVHQKEIAARLIRAAGLSHLYVS